MMHAVCTLFEGHYHLGVGALINSLHASGFTGRVICGHRGPEPAWAGAARQLRDGITVTFVPVETDAHFTNYKPQFLLHCWDTLCPEATQLYYFDPDIVVKAPWSVLARWAADGVALCEDVNGYLPARHPYRLAWSDFLTRKNPSPNDGLAQSVRRSGGIPAAVREQTATGMSPLRELAPVDESFGVIRPLDRYYNAGFVGVPRACRSVLEIWTRLIACAERELGSKNLMKHEHPGALFHTPDQDALNMALMVTDAPVNGVGPEGMDFATGGHLLSHALGARKPWRGGFVGDALRGRPPGPAQKSFFRFANAPLRLFPSTQLAWLRLSLRSGALLGRMYRRA